MREKHPGPVVRNQVAVGVVNEIGTIEYGRGDGYVFFKLEVGLLNILRVEIAVVVVDWDGILAAHHIENAVLDVEVLDILVDSCDVFDHREGVSLDSHKLELGVVEKRY